MKRSGPLRRVAQLKRKRRGSVLLDDAARDLFQKAVLAKGDCVLKGHAYPCDGALDPHHVIPKQRLKQRHGLSPAQRRELAWDARNGVPVCRRHHELLTNRVMRLPHEVVPGEVFAFAHDYGLDHLLDRELVSVYHRTDNG